MDREKVIDTSNALYLGAGQDPDLTGYANTHPMKDLLSQACLVWVKHTKDGNSDKYRQGMYA